jgi:integrase
MECIQNVVRIEHYCLVSKIFTIAARHEKVDANPCQGVEFKAMEDNAQLKDIVTVALHTGMRRGEIFNLKWFDLDFDRGVMHVRKTKTKLNRVVPMNARVREVLKSTKAIE